MPQVQHVSPEHQHYSARELIVLRRDTLRLARSFPPGPERNQHRQIAASLRRLFSSESWLAEHGPAAKLTTQP